MAAPGAGPALSQSHLARSTPRRTLYRRKPHERYWPDDGARVWSATYSPDGKRIVTASEDKTARVWEAETGRQVAELKGHGAIVSSAKYSPDGKRIVTASEDKTARVWEAETGRQVAGLKGHRDIVLSAKYSPDGKRIVTASEDKTARVWEAETGRQVAELKGHRGRVGSAKYSRTASASSPRARTRRPVCRGGDGASGRGAEGAWGHRREREVFPDGKRIVTVSADKTARVWEAETGRQVAELKGHGNIVWSAMYSPDGKRIITVKL